MAIAFQYLTYDEKKDVTRIAGHRIRVYDVAGYIREGYTPRGIAEDYRLPLAAVYEALAYYAWAGSCCPKGQTMTFIWKKRPSWARH
ncbi:MAG: DUF433 domain-containing protein [Chloroflexota bacterium]